MRHLFKSHINELIRMQTSQGRNLDGLRLDRNERVDPIPAEILNEVFASIRPCDIAAHPESAPLYEDLASFLDLSRDEIFIVDGISVGINVLYATLCEPHHNVVVLDPTYPMYGVFAKLNNIEYRPFTYGADLKPDWATLEAAVDENTAFVVVANPNLPVESAFDKSELMRLAEFCKDRGCGLVVDEAYHYFGGESAVELIHKFENIVVMRSFSKAFGMASIRLGFMVSTPKNIEYLSKTRSIIESNTLSMAFGSYMVKHPEILENHVRQVKEGAAYIKAELAKLGLRFHGGEFTNGILIFLDGIASPDDVIAFMQERDVYIRGSFAAPFDQCIRISIGSKNSMETFVTLFKEWFSKNKY